MVKSLLIVNTGDGKGKTTAALGQVFRAVGHGFKVCILQFLKGNWKYGEMETAKKFPGLLEFHTLGRGFTWRSENIEQDILVAKRAWEFAKENIASGKFKMIVLDELTYLISYGIIDETEVLECLRNRPDGLHVIVTGRDASTRLKDLADLVTEMKEVKHPYHMGIKGQRGIEF